MVTKKEKDYKLRYLYGISLKEYNQLLKFQNNRCGICGNPPKTRGLHVDHKHLPDERRLRKKKQQKQIRAAIRGLLCWVCNTAITKFKDNPKLLRKAALYLEQLPAKHIIKDTR